MFKDKRFQMILFAIGLVGILSVSLLLLSRGDNSYPYDSSGMSKWATKVDVGVTYFPKTKGLQNPRILLYSTGVKGHNEFVYIIAADSDTIRFENVGDTLFIAETPAHCPFKIVSKYAKANESSVYALITQTVPVKAKENLLKD